MTSINSLPEELHVLIARHVSDGDLPRLALVCRYYYRPARLATMWTTQGSDSAFRFSKLLQDNKQLATLIRALVVDRAPSAKRDSEGEGEGAEVDGVEPGGVGARFTLEQGTWSVNFIGQPEVWLEERIDQLVMRPIREVENQKLFDLSLQLISQCRLLQRFFMLTPPPSWSPISIEHAHSQTALNQQIRLLDGVARLEQLCVFGVWDESDKVGMVAQVQMRFAAFRHLLKTAPPKLRNLSFPIEGPPTAADWFDDGDENGDDAWKAQVSAATVDEDMSSLPERAIGDVQLTLFRLTKEHYNLIADSIFHSVRRLTLDISTTDESVPTPEIIKVLFDETKLSGDRLEWYTVDIACLKEESNPLTLGVRPRWPLLCLVHDGGLFAVMGKGALNETDRERFFTLKKNSIITKAIVWKRKQMEDIVGELSVLVPEVEIVEV